MVTSSGAYELNEEWASTSDYIHGPERVKPVTIYFNQTKSCVNDLVCLCSYLL